MAQVVKIRKILTNSQQQCFSQWPRKRGLEGVEIPGVSRENLQGVRHNIFSLRVAEIGMHYHQN
jgi:hypothetical protein